MAKVLITGTSRGIGFFGLDARAKRQSVTAERE
jgi:hypothetical protein